MELILIRHGQIPSNMTGALDTAVPGPDLTELGIRQAEAIPSALSNRDVQTVAVSNLVRTAQTARPLLSALNLDANVDPGFAEVAAGNYEMHTDDRARQGYLKTAWGWADGDLSKRIPGGEDGFEAMGRFTDAVARVYATGADSAVVFSHGTAIRVWSALAIAEGGGPTGMVKERIDNSGAVFLTGEPGSWQLKDWHTLPLGGSSLVPTRRNDPTGEGEPK